MARKEFTRAIKVAVIKMATVDGKTFCEECGSLAKRWEIDHVRPDGLLGEATIENAKLLCTPCHDEKTKGTLSKLRKRRDERRFIWASEKNRACAAADFRNRQRLRNSQ